MIIHKQQSARRSRNLFALILLVVLPVVGLSAGGAAQTLEVNPALGHPKEGGPNIFLYQQYPGGPDTVGFDFETSMEGWDFILPPDSILVESVCEDTCTFCWNLEEAPRPHDFIYPWMEEPGTLRWIPAFKGFYNSDCDQEWQVKAISAPVGEGWECLRRFEVRMVNRIDRPVYARLGYRVAGSDTFTWPGDTSDWVLMPQDEWMVLGYDDQGPGMLNNVAEVAIMLGGWYAVGDVFIDKVEAVSFYYPDITLYPPYAPPIIVGETGRVRVRADVQGLMSPSYTTGPLPENATFSTFWDYYADQVVGELLFTPTEEQVGNHEVTFYASACQSTVSGNVVISVYDSLAEPVLEPIGPKSVDEMQRLDFFVYASDPNHDRLTMTADPLPDNATFSSYSGTQGRFVFLPEPDQVGEHAVTFYVTDGHSMVSETVIITVNDVNLPPFVFEDGHRTIYENDTLTYDIWSFDGDGTTPFLFANLSGEDTLATNMSFVDNRDGTGTLAFMPDETQGGSYLAPNNFYVIFRAVDEKDPALFQNSATVTFSVLDPNLPPVFVNVTPRSVAEGDTLYTTVEANDPNGDSIVLSSPVHPDWATFTDNGDGTGLLVSTPGYDHAGYHWLYLRASDGVDSTTSNYFIVVENSNRAPQFLTQFEDVTLVERDYYSITLEAEDPDGDSISFAGLHLPEGASLADNGDGTGTFSFTSEYEHVGNNYPIMLEVVDSNLSDQAEFQITVENLPLTIGQTGGEADVLIDSAIIIPFNELIDETTVAGNVTVTSVRGETPDVMPSVRNETSVLVIQPTSGLFAQADTLNVSIGTGVLDRAGFPLSSPYGATFTTGAGVYPGDTDNNGVVDERDILPIGLFFETSGPARTEPGTVFELTSVHLTDGASTWAPYNAVYADADGSGEVNADDICAITDNWLLTTGAVTGAAKAEAQERLNIVVGSLKGDVIGQMQESLADCPDGPGKAALVQALGTFGSAGGSDALPTVFELAQNYPNPFNPTTTIEYALPVGAHATLTIYNVMGQKVATLIDRYETAGYHQVVWDGRDVGGGRVASGVYLYRLETDQTVLTRRMLLLK